MAEDYGRLQVAQIPGLPEQEAEAEAAVLSGATTAPERQQSTPYAVPIDTTTDEEVDLQGGDSDQVDWLPPSSEGASAVSHQHYWIHTVEETMDRGYYGFNSNAFTLKEGVPLQLLGLDDLRPLAVLVALAMANAEDETAVIYIGDRDIIDSGHPEQTGIWFTSQGSSYNYRARKELWAVVIGGTATIGITSYKSEPTSGTLADKSASGR